MNGHGESYSGILPTKRSNEGRGGPKEIVEGRPLTKENAEQLNPHRTPSRESGPSGLDRVRQAAKGDKQLRFTALLHHVNIDLKGWRNYFDFGYPRVAFREINTYIRYRLTQHLRRRSQRPFRPPEGVSYYEQIQRFGLVRL